MSNKEKNTQSNEEISNFTPPPPLDNLIHNPNNDFCYYHHDEPAVTNCAKCGKSICQNCQENFSVEDGEYAGQPLCYDCCKALVAAKIQELTIGKKKILFKFALSLVGMAFGFIMGFFDWPFLGEEGGSIKLALLLAVFGGVFLTTFKIFASLLWKTFKGFIHSDSRAMDEVFISLFIIPLKCIYLTIKNTIFYILYLKRISHFIKSSIEILNQVNEYIEYILIRIQNKNIPLDDLLNSDSKLAHNGFARMVQTEGEDKAKADIRQSIATINDYNETIKNFLKATHL